MRHKIVSWFFILMMLSGMILIFSPDSIQAAPTTFTEYFETTVVGNQVSGSWIDTAEDSNYATDFHVVQDQGSDNQFQIGDRASGATGWFNYTYDVAKYITNYTFNFYTSYIAASTNYVFMYFNDSDENTIIKFQFTHLASSYYYIYYFSHSLGSVELIGKVLNAKWTQVSWEIVSPTVIRYSAANASVLSNGLINVDYNSLNYRITSVYSSSGTVGGSEVGTKLLDNLSIITDYNTTGNTTINVYNETSPSTAIPNWNLRIYDENNAIQYSKNNLNNPVTINHTLYGSGNMFFEISASNYYNRTYYADIKTGIHYLLNAFLLNKNNTDAHIYTCIVVDDSDLDAILYINDAEIVITRIINGSIHEISSGFTDGSGRFYVPLIAGVTYTVNITATGYDTLRDTYVPSSTVFEQTFRMTATSPTSTSYDDFWENISIDISMVSAGCMQDGNITITYLDSNSSTTNTEIQLWEIYGPNNTLLNTWTNTSNSFFNKNGSINTTRVHYMVLFFNNTAFFTVSQPITIMIPNVDSPFCDRVEPFDLDDRITDIVGPFTIDGHEAPWTVVIGTIVPIIILVSFGPFNTGLGIIGCGISMTMMQGFLHMYVSGGFEWRIAGIGAFIVILGIMYIMTKGTGGDHL